jgi:Helicase conserved C-terminal domain
VQDREATQQDFSLGRLKVIVATVAFGMGMDIANVRTVIHLTLPRTLEDYVQQVRDQTTHSVQSPRCAGCLICMSGSTRTISARLRNLSHGSSPGPIIKPSMLTNLGSCAVRWVGLAEMVQKLQPTHSCWTRNITDYVH